DFCDADMETVQDGNGAFPDVCPLGRDDCDDDDPMLTSPIWYVDGDTDGYGQTDDFLETCTPPGAGYAPLGNDCDDTNAMVNPAAREICDDIDNNCVEGADEGCDEDDDDYCNMAMTVSDPPPATCPNGGGDCDDMRAEAYPGAEELCNDVVDNC